MAADYFPGVSTSVRIIIILCTLRVHYTRIFEVIIGRRQDGVTRRQVL